MSNSATSNAVKNPASGMGIFERYLTLWVGLCIIAGIVLGQAIQSVFHAIGGLTVAQVNIPQSCQSTELRRQGALKLVTR